MYCKKCGKELREGAEYCGNCGAPVQTPPNPKKKNWKWLAILAAVGCIVFVLAVFAGSAIAISQEKEEVDENSNIYADGDMVYNPQKENLQWDENEEVIYYDNLVDVYLMEELSKHEEDEIAKQIDGKIVTRIHGAILFLQIKVEPTDYKQISAYADELRKNDKVMDALYDAPGFAQPDAIDENPWSADGTVIADKNSTPPSGNDWWAEAVGAYEVWNYIDDHKDELSDVTVGIIDNGFDVDHEDLRNAEGSDKIAPLKGYETNSEEDHGTHVMGLIGANNNTVGIRGIADLANIRYVDWLLTSNTDDEEESLLNNGQYIWIISNMMEKNYVINNSWGWSNFWVDKKQYDKSEHDNMSYEDYCKTFENESVYDTRMCLNMLLNAHIRKIADKYLIIKSAGNGDSKNKALDVTLNGNFASITKDVFDSVIEKYFSNNVKEYLKTNGITYEKLKEHILIVGAVENMAGDGKYNLATYSNYGDNVDICAPGGGTEEGTKIFSTVLSENGAYAEEAGTSMAAPIVSGSAAVLWQIAPDLTAAEVKKLLIETAGVAHPTADKDTRESYPMLNTAAAVKKVVAEKKGATHVKCEIFSEETELNGKKTDGEYVVATGYDAFDQEIWQFKSDTIPITEMPTYYEVGVHGNKYYLEVGWTLYAFTLSKGEQLWSCELGSSISDHVFDEDDNLYVCCYYGPDFCQINADGEVVKQIDAFYTEPDAMFWPSKIEYGNNKVLVTMDGSSDGEGGIVTVDLKDYSYTRSDEELVERRKNAKKAKYKLLNETLKKYKDAEVTPAYSEMDLDGNSISEIIIRTFTDQATEGGRYIYQIYSYNGAKDAYTCDVEEFYSFRTDEAVHYYYEDKIIKLAVDWTFADEIDFVIYTYDGSGLTEEEVTDDLSSYFSVEFRNITELDMEVYEKTRKEEPADPQKKYDIEDFIGYYCMDIDEELLEKYPNMNPEIIDLYFNEDGSLEAARKYRFGTTGTSNFYPYDSYKIEGNTLICQYSRVESFFDETSETGEHRYQLTSNGNLIADQEVWFRHNMEE